MNEGLVGVVLLSKRVNFLIIPNPCVINQSFYPKLFKNYGLGRKEAGKFEL
jgi:hypothetical protein